MNIIITGASKGIGKAIAEIFARHKHHLFLCARHENALQATAAVLQKKHPAAIIKTMTCDVSRTDEAKAFGAWCLEYGVPDVVINNAGAFLPGKVCNEPDGQLENQVATNLYSAYHVTRAVLPWMMEHRRGHIFNICSIAGQQPYENGGAYSISKFAMDGFSKNLRHEMKGYNIKVTTVYPGAVLTDSWGNFDNSQHRIMEADDVAQMVYAATQLSKGACAEEIVLRPQQGDL
jgi:short-subunit dehydrogenase